MRVLVLYNPIAGAGRASVQAAALPGPLTGAGHEATLAETRLDPQKQWLDPLLADCDLVVVVGGDGAMRLVSGAAGRTGTPIYHFPLGTENLCAREFGSDRSIPRLLAAIERFHVDRFDLGIANGRKFLLMASIGFDAEVIHDLSARRGRGISHLSYLGPIARQLARFKPPRLTITVDGKAIVDGEEGFVVIANSRQYARRLDPAVRASMTDGRLDVVFFPTGSRFELAGWIVSCLRRRQMANRRLVYRQGCEIEVASEPCRRYQLDGDPPEPGPDGPDEMPGEAGSVTRLCISIRPGFVPILIP